MDTGSSSRLGLIRAYGMLYRNAFRFSGTAGVREYWFAILVQAILASFSAVCLFIGYVLADFFLPVPSRIFAIIGAIFAVVFSLGVLCSISLTVRRLRDAGKSAWWSCLLLAVGAGTLFVLLLCASATVSFSAESNAPVCVYGPPEWFDPSLNQNPDVYGPPEWFDPSDNQNDTVYGPPEWPENDSPDTIDYDPSENFPVEVYGPPEWFESNQDASSED